MDGGAWCRLLSMGSQRVGHDWEISLHYFACSQSTGGSALASVLQMNIQDWFPFGWTGWICLCSKELSRVFSNTTVQKYQFFSTQHYGPVPHLYMTTGKTIVSTIRTFVSKVISLLFNMLFRLVIAFLLRSKHVLISWLHSPDPLILEPPKIKSVTVSIVSPSICHEVMRPEAMIFVFECWVLSPFFHSPLSLRGSLVPLHFLP